MQKLASDCFKYPKNDSENRVDDKSKETVIRIFIFKGPTLV